MNEREHAGEVALVTGANKGLGREIARRLVARDVSFVWLERATEANNSIVDRLSRGASKSHAEN